MKPYWSLVSDELRGRPIPTVYRIGSFGSANPQSPFVQINELEHRLDRAGWQTDFGKTFVQPLRAGIVPA